MKPTAAATPATTIIRLHGHDQGGHAPGDRRAPRHQEGEEVSEDGVAEQADRDDQERSAGEAAPGRRRGEEVRAEGDGEEAKREVEHIREDEMATRQSRRRRVRRPTTTPRTSATNWIGMLAARDPISIRPPSAAESSARPRLRVMIHYPEKALPCAAWTVGRLDPEGGRCVDRGDGPTDQPQPRRWLSVQAGSSGPGAGSALPTTHRRPERPRRDRLAGRRRGLPALA